MKKSLKRKLMLSSAIVAPLSSIAFMSAETNTQPAETTTTENTNSTTNNLPEGFGGNFQDILNAAKSRVLKAMSNAYYTQTEATEAALNIFKTPEVLAAYSEAQQNQSRLVTTETFNKAMEAVKNYDMKAYLYNLYIKPDTQMEKIQKFENFNSTSKWIYNYMNVNGKFKITVNGSDALLASKETLLEEIKDMDEIQAGKVIKVWADNVTMLRRTLYDFVLTASLLSTTVNLLETHKTDLYKNVYEYAQSKLSGFAKFFETNTFYVPANYDSNKTYEENVNNLSEENKELLNKSIQTLNKWFNDYKAKQPTEGDNTSAKLAAEYFGENATYNAIDEELFTIANAMVNANNPLGKGHNFDSNFVSTMPFDDADKSAFLVQLLSDWTWLNEFNSSKTAEKDKLIEELRNKVEELDKQLKEATKPSQPSTPSTDKPSSTNSEKLNKVVWWVIGFLTVLVLIMLVALVIKKSHKKETK